MKTEPLICTKNFDSDDIYIEQGRISFCMVHNAPHFFIYIESGTYDDGTWCPDTQDIRIAFSYVPESSYKYLQYNTSLRLSTSLFAPKVRIDSKSYTYMYGYIFFLFTKSYVVDTWKLTDTFIRLNSIIIKPGWKYERYPQFSIYNIFSFVPYFGITDCIGYSKYHFFAAARRPGNNADRKAIRRGF